MNEIPFQEFNGEFDLLRKNSNQRYFEDDSYQLN